MAKFNEDNWNQVQKRVYEKKRIACQIVQIFSQNNLTIQQAKDILCLSTSLLEQCTVTDIEN